MEKHTYANKICHGYQNLIIFLHNQHCTSMVLYVIGEIGQGLEELLSFLRKSVPKQSWRMEQPWGLKKHDFWVDNVSCIKKCTQTIVVRAVFGWYLSGKKMNQPSVKYPIAVTPYLKFAGRLNIIPRYHKKIFRMIRRLLEQIRSF